MSNDDDFGFDFGEAPTEELAVQRPSQPRRKLIPSPWTPLLRLLAIVVLTIVITVAFVLVIGSATATSRFDRYRAYLKNIAALTADSQRVGAQTSRMLTSATDVASAVVLLNNLRQRQQHHLARLAQLQPPAALRAAHANAIDVFALRVSALSRLHDVLEAHAPLMANLLLQPAEWLLASDVNWQTLFQAPVSALLRQEKLSGLFPPPSRFLVSGDLATSSALAASAARFQALTPNSSVILKLGDHGAAVAGWQTEIDRWLAGQSRPRPLTADGTFGPATDAATRAFQEAEGLPPDGIVGSQTRRALTRALAQPG